MFNRLTITSLLTALVAFVQNSQAAFITGSVDFTGTAGINGTGPLNATSFPSFTGVHVDIGTGSYVGTVGAAATFQPFSFNPASAPVTGLWSFSVGATHYSFDLATFVLEEQGVPADGPGLGVIQVNGTGTAHITGFSDTPASFVLHASGGVTDVQLALGSSTAGGAFSVPDGGGTALLLSSGLGLLAFLRRKSS